MDYKQKRVVPELAADTFQKPKASAEIPAKLTGTNLILV
jgi:hypothetical protein